VELHHAEDTHSFGHSGGQWAEHGRGAEGPPPPRGERSPVPEHGDRRREREEAYARNPDQPLPARPMFLLRVSEEVLGDKAIELYLKEVIAGLPEDAVVSLRLEGAPEWVESLGLSARLLREIAPETMNISLGVRFQDQNQNPPAGFKPAGG
jgi:hypothetical protein